MDWQPDGLARCMQYAPHTKAGPIRLDGMTQMGHAVTLRKARAGLHYPLTADLFL